MGENRANRQKQAYEKLLKENYEKVMEALAAAAGEAESGAVDPLEVAYVAGRLDGVTDALGMRRMSA